MEYKSKAYGKQEKSKYDPSSLKDLRKVLNVFVNEANERVSQLRDSDVESPALVRAYTTLRKTDRERFDSDEDMKEGSGLLFDISNKKGFKQLQRELGRVEEFLAASSSHVNIASAEQKATEAYKRHGLSFHNQADEQTGLDNIRFRGYDQERIKLALSIYRRLESTNAGATLIYGNNGKGGFGSDNLFNLIFDEIEGYDPNMPEQMVDRITEKAMVAGSAALEEYRHADMFGFLRGAPRSRKRDQNVLSEMAKAENAEIFFKRNKWLKERSW